MVRERRPWDQSAVSVANLLAFDRDTSNTKWRLTLKWKSMSLASRLEIWLTFKHRRRLMCEWIYCSKSISDICHSKWCTPFITGVVVVTGLAHTPSNNAFVTNYSLYEKMSRCWVVLVLIRLFVSSLPMQLSHHGKGVSCGALSRSRAAVCQETLG